VFGCNTLLRANLTTGCDQKLVSLTYTPRKYILKVLPNHKLKKNPSFMETELYLEQHIIYKLFFLPRIL
jgi:hypothetical protein